METSLKITPSTTYRGVYAPMIDVTPRRVTRAPPPGAPEFVEMSAPASFPCRDCSTVAVGTLTSCSAVTVETAFARFFFSMPVAWPVTIRVCPHPVTEPTASRSAANNPERYVITRALPSKRVRGRDHIVKITRRCWGGLDPTAHTAEHDTGQPDFGASSLLRPD